MLGLIAEGCTNKEVGARLGLSEKTVKNHVRNIFHKLQVYDRTQAAILAIRKGLIELTSLMRPSLVTPVLRVELKPCREGRVLNSSSRVAMILTGRPNRASRNAPRRPAGPGFASKCPPVWRG